MTLEPQKARRLDRDAYGRADKALRLVGERLPQSEVEALAREVVRRLSFRSSLTIDRLGHPNDAEIEQLCQALLSDDEHAGDRTIMAVRRSGVSIEMIFVGYIAGAARMLGTMWDEDIINFVDVTLGTGRLYRILRGLRHVVGPPILAGRTEKHTLFALVPGETHTLGIEIAADLFRRDGWEIDMMVDATHDKIIAFAEQHVFKAIVLVANSEKMIAPLARLVLGLRIVQPTTDIILAGNITEQVSDISDVVGADGVVTDVNEAIAVLRGIVAP